MPTPVGTGIPIMTPAVIPTVTAAADSMVGLATAAAVAILGEEVVAEVVGIEFFERSNLTEVSARNFMSSCPKTQLIRLFF